MVEIALIRNVEYETELEATDAFSPEDGDEVTVPSFSDKPSEFSVL
jgi:hypothetical protein